MGKANHRRALIVRKRRCFAGRADRDDAVNAGRNLLFDEFLKGGAVDLPRAEGSDECRKSAAKHGRHCKGEAEPPQSDWSDRSAQHFAALRFFPIAPRFSTFRIESGANGTSQEVLPMSTVTGPIFSPTATALSVNVFT